MAGRDLTVSSARVNEPTENSSSQDDRERRTTEDTGVTVGHASVTDGPSRDAGGSASVTDAKTFPCQEKNLDAVGGARNDEDRHKSQTVKLAQKANLDESKSKKSQTSGGTAPNVDEQICEKKLLKIDHIDPSVVNRACNLLNIHQVMGIDWRGLAAKLKYSYIDVKIFEGESNSAESLLRDWSSKGNRNNLESLVEALREINRQDVIGLFQEEIDKKGDRCNCDNCGHLT